MDFERNSNGNEHEHTEETKHGDQKEFGERSQQNKDKNKVGEQAQRKAADRLSEKRKPDRSDEFRDRDDPIKQLLLSEDEKKQKDGMEQLEETFRWLVAAVLVSRARGKKRNSGALFMLVDRESGALLVDAFDEYWQRALMCVWKNVQNGSFQAQGSLLAYLVKITFCRIVDDYRAQRRHAITVDFGEPPDVMMSEPPVDLIEALSEIVESLPNEKDREILRLGTQLAVFNGSPRGIREELTKEFAKICLEYRWTEMSQGAVVRRLNRLRVGLRESLLERGYDV